MADQPIKTSLKTQLIDAALKTGKSLQNAFDTIKNSGIAQEFSAGGETKYDGNVDLNGNPREATSTEQTHTNKGKGIQQ